MLIHGEAGVWFAMAVHVSSQVTTILRLCSSVLFARSSILAECTTMNAARAYGTEVVISSDGFLKILTAYSIGNCSMLNVNAEGLA